MSSEIIEILREFERIDVAYRRFVAAADWAEAARQLEPAAHISSKLRYLLSHRGAVASIDGRAGDRLKRFRDGAFAIQEMISRLSVEPDYSAADWPPEGRWVPDAHLFPFLKTIDDFDFTFQSTKLNSK